MVEEKERSVVDWKRQGDFSAYDLVPENQTGVRGIG